MSLFICMSCRCIENTDLNSKNIHTIKGRPNMVRMEMDGFSTNSKERGEINYICRECNNKINGSYGVYTIETNLVNSAKNMEENYEI